MGRSLRKVIPASARLGIADEGSDGSEVRLMFGASPKKLGVGLANGTRE
jgi:hypothetical protein